MNREFIALNGMPPSPLWVPAHGPVPEYAIEHALAYCLHEGASEQLAAMASWDGSKRTGFLRSTLRALRRVGFAVERWVDALRALGAAEPDDDWCRAFADEQSARQRFAWELLVEVIGFSTTDDAEFWEHHAALTRLQQRAGKRSDARAFFSCESASLDLEFDQGVADVVACEARLGERLAHSWYAKSRTTGRSAAQVEKSALSAMSSQRTRLQFVLQHASHTERVALGVSYQRMYSQLSRQIHFSGLSTDSVSSTDHARGHGTGLVGLDDIDAALTAVARLGLLALVRIQSLTGLHGGVACRAQREVRDQLPADQDERLLKTLMLGSSEPGDFVLVGDLLAVVRDRQVNDAGYGRYRVKYICERPDTSIAEEWRPATDVHTIWAPARVDEWVREMEPTLPDEARAAWDALDDEQRRLTYLEAAWPAGLRAQVVAKLAESEAAFS